MIQHHEIDEHDAFPEVLEYYCVFDTVLKVFWQTPKRKFRWQKQNYAKNAVNANPPGWMRKPNTRCSYLKFSEQDRLRVVRGEYRLIEHKIQ